MIDEPQKPTERDLVFSAMLHALEEIVRAKEAEDQYGYSDTQVHYMFKTAFNKAVDAIALAKGVKEGGK